VTQVGINNEIILKQKRKVLGCPN